MAFNYVKLNEEKLPKSLGVKGKNQDGIRYYTIDGVNMPSVTSILGAIPERKVKIEGWRNAVGEKMANYISASATNRGKATHTLIENHIRNQDEKSMGITAVTPLGLFRIIKPYLARLDNIHCVEEYLYSKEISVAGQVDCIAEYNGKLSVIDFKTSNKYKQEDWVQGYFQQCTAYAIMYEELFGTPIEQIVVLIACEDGNVQTFVKEKKDFIEPLKEQIAGFYKYYEELNKDKITSQS